MIRLMAAGAIGKGATSALLYIWYLSRYAFPMGHALVGLNLIVFIFYLIPALFGLGLAGGGWLCWQYIGRGRRIVVWLTAINSVVIAMTTLLDSFRFSPSMISYRFAQIPTLINLAASLVLPAILWCSSNGRKWWPR